MNKEDFKKVKGLMKEKQLLDEKYLRFRANPKKEVADVVSDYKTGYPKSLLIRGYGDVNYVKLRQKIYDKQLQVNKALSDFEQQIEAVQDPEIRYILRCQYVKGMKLHEIAKELGYSTDGIKKKLQKFWRNI